jgi:hypothetical protein
VTPTHISIHASNLAHTPPQTQNTEYRIQNTEYRIQNTEYRI